MVEATPLIECHEALVRCVLGVVLVAGGLPPVQAQVWQWQGSAGVLSNKVEYGISQSGGSASAVLDLKLSSVDGWVAGAGVASLPAERGGAELNLLAGRSGPMGSEGAWQATVGVFAPLGSGRLRAQDYLQVGLGYAWNERLQLNLRWVPNLAGPASGGGSQRGRVVALEASWHQPIGHRLALDAGIGQVDFGPLALPRHVYGSLGLSAGWGPMQVFVTRVFSDSASPAAVGPRALVSVLVNF
jgi:hypothetical protein